MTRQPYWRELPVLACVFLDLLGFGMVVSDLQLRAQALTPKGISPGAAIGVILASTFVIQTATSPAWGKAADRVGRKPVLLICTSLSALAMFTYGIGGSLWLIFLSRLIAGFGGANVAVAQAMAGDLKSGHERTVALGRIGAAVSGGLIVGAASGGYLVHACGYRFMAFLASSLSALGVLAVAIFVSSSPRGRGGEEEAQSKPRGGLALLEEYPTLRRYAGIAVVAWLSLATLEGTFARLISRLFGYDQREFGLLFGYEALIGFAVQAWLLATLLRRFRETPLLRFSYLIQGFGLAWNPAAVLFVRYLPPLSILFLASTGLAVGGGVANPVVNGICSRLVPESRQGELFGLLQSVRSVGFIVGPIVGGLLFDWWAPAPYLLAGAVCVAAAVLVPEGQPRSGHLGS